MSNDILKKLIKIANNQQKMLQKLAQNTGPAPKIETAYHHLTTNISFWLDKIKYNISNAMQNSNEASSIDEAIKNISGIQQTCSETVTLLEEAKRDILASTK